MNPNKNEKRRKSLSGSAKRKHVEGSSTSSLPSRKRKIRNPTATRRVPAGARPDKTTVNKGQGAESDEKISERPRHPPNTSTFQSGKGTDQEPTAAADGNEIVLRTKKNQRKCGNTRVSSRHVSTRSA